MARTLPSTLAAIVEDLEVEQPVVVPMRTLRELVDRHGIGTSAKVVASRLRAHGWLLPTPNRGVWEFAPGSHAGPHGHQDPTLPLRSALAAHPSLHAALALTSAAWAHGYADRTPSRLTVASPDRREIPVGLARSTCLRIFVPRLSLIIAKGVPVHRCESVLAHMATSPSHVDSWPAVFEWLPDLAGSLDAANLHTELHGRSAATRARAGYLLSGLRPDLAHTLRSVVRGPARFGARDKVVRRHNNEWRIVDALLPVDPTSLSAVPRHGRARATHDGSGPKHCSTCHSILPRDHAFTDGQLSGLGPPDRLGSMQ